ncbi:hypothetical protein SAMN02745181_2082 [Rubritalea squalenifaciens DSM 18772]|uniref:Uncharacterized protein n=1 Tax=Rubritalea squalenifaciens DSM 18772 TaxID=1123071 RepID=A0A1M6JCR9_9BACT|nr:hypothetical protein [Rubritalea squalenifaciens]SHJ44509.1 hypothetical protein SAMN02745181_2082 [Rubritalea squalenifaciens DSM 18772]
MSWLCTSAEHIEKLRETLHAEVVQNPSGSSLRVTTTPDDKLFIFESREMDWTFHRPEIRALLSTGCEIMFCTLEDHVMASECALWRNGEEVWHVQHNNELSVYHLDARGDIPPRYLAIKQDHMDTQCAEGGERGQTDHMLTVPIQLAAELTGFDSSPQLPEGRHLSWQCHSPKSPSLIPRIVHKISSMI